MKIKRGVTIEQNGNMFREEFCVQLRNGSWFCTIILRNKANNIIHMAGSQR